MISVQILRRVALLMVILMSGGLLFIPRVPLLAALVALYFLIPKRQGFNKQLVPYILFTVTVVCLEMFRQEGADYTQGATRIANFVAGMLIANIYFSYGKTTFQLDFFAVVKFFPVQAILTTVLGTLAPTLFVPVSDTGVKTFGYLLYHHTSDLALSFGVIRPDGFFWEPGVLQLYLALGLYIALFSLKKRYTAVVFGIAIACTQSTVGIAVAVGLVLIYVLQNTRKGAIFTSISFIVILTPLVFYFIANYENKTEGAAKGSFLVRQFDTFTGVAIALNNPLIGIGFDHTSFIRAQWEYGYFTPEFESKDLFENRRDNTNGLVQPFYSLGLFLGLICIIGLVRQRLLDGKYAPAFILLSTLASEPLIFTPFFLMLIVTGMGLRKGGTFVVPPNGAGSLYRRVRQET
jgi:hypothetical protein